ncbi:MAG: urease accessory protein UreE [Ferruginibacter sp.]
MLITKKLGKLKDDAGKTIDLLCLHWYETNKRILHKQTATGKNISLKFLNENPDLSVGDILYEDETMIIVVDILPATAIVIQPSTMFEMASLCYEIGNKHLPLFYENDLLLVPYETPLHKYLQAAGYSIRVEERKLQRPLRTTVTPHGSGSETLFSKVMKLTAEKK